MLFTIALSLKNCGVGWCECVGEWGWEHGEAAQELVGSWTQKQRGGGAHLHGGRAVDARVLGNLRVLLDVDLHKMDLHRQQGRVLAVKS